jgi:RNA polymerase sigma-70 factor (ECF subfamily)
MLAHHAWSDFVAGRQRAGRAVSGAPADDVLHSVPARDDLEARLAEAFDLELLELATARVRARVEAKTWEAFRLTAMEGLSGAEASARLGMQVAAVFKAKSNVQKLLQEEIRTLEGGESP